MNIPMRDRRDRLGLLIACALLVIGMLAIFSGSTAKASVATNEGVCEGTHIDGDNQTSITITAPEGQLISSICVKAGSILQGDGPEIITYDPPVASVTFEHSSGKEISHYTVTYVPVVTTTTSTTEPPIPTLFAFGGAGTECQAEVPVILITFANTFPELAGDTGELTITALADDSVIDVIDVVYAPGETIEILYPGAEVDDEGNIIDLPGWTLQDNGLWVIDESDAFLREGLLLTYNLGEETATAEVTYPPESSLCANPPENPPVTTPTTDTPNTLDDVVTPLSPPVGAPPGSLPQTGSFSWPLTLAGVGCLASGSLLLIARRKLV